jgi:hypothetical protein
MKLELATLKKLVCQRRTGAFALLSLFLFVLGMAQFESLHRAIHCDAAQPEHQCAVTLIQSGQIDAPTSAAAPVSIPVQAAAQPVPEVVFVSPPAFSLLPSRGPPALS